MFRSIIFIVCALFSPNIIAVYCGIMPYSYDNQGEAIVLLSKDSSRKGYDFFGGSLEKKESIRHAAAREFIEESVGLYTKLYGKTFKSATKKLAKCLYRKPFFHLPKQKNHPAHYIYPLQVSYIPPQEFKNAIINPKLPHCFKEKKDFVWVYVTDLILTLKSERKVDLQVQRINNDNCGNKSNIMLDNGIIKTLRQGGGIKFIESIER